MILVGIDLFMIKKSIIRYKKKKYIYIYIYFWGGSRGLMDRASDL